MVELKVRCKFTDERGPIFLQEAPIEKYLNLPGKVCVMRFESIILTHHDW